jgi:hypothetical protein
LVRFALAKARSLAIKRAIIGGTSFAGSTAAWLVSLASSVKRKVAVDGGRKIDGDLHWSVVGTAESFSLVIVPSPYP